MSPKTKRNVYRIIPFGVTWLVFGFVYSQLERGLLGELNYYPATGNPYSYSSSTFVTAIFALFTGLFMGTLEVLYLNRFFVQKSLGKKIAYKSFIYLVTITLFLIVVTIVANIVELNTSIFDERVWDNLRLFFSDYAFFSVGVYMAAIILISLFYAEVSENIGQTVLANFFTGKYHKPIQEDRIYMFADMRSSTTIAQNLGHIRYFEMLKEYYADLTDPIIEYSGEIYQYVGDEIVVSWTIKRGLQNNNCVRCFFAMKKALENQAGKYLEQFGVLPEFKAGFHQGRVTTGEIGIAKKEIIFTGDVLNTASRIQGLCNTLEVDNLISRDLIAKLNLSPQFQVISLGLNELRGRSEKLELFTLHLKDTGEDFGLRFAILL